MEASRVPRDIVESTLLAIITNPSAQSVVIMFRMQQHEFKLVARGVVHLLVNEFVEQNIVHEVRVIDRNSQATSIRDALANLVFDCEYASEITHPGLISKPERYTSDVIEAPARLDSRSWGISVTTRCVLRMVRIS
jgi:hypothetical protein